MRDLYVAVVVLLILLVIIYVLKYARKPRTSEQLSNKLDPDYYMLHYADWCGHCKTMKPIWEEVTSELTKACLNDTTSKCPDFRTNDEAKNQTEGIEGVPTILRYNADGSKDKYDGGPDKDKLRAFLSK